MSRRGLHWGWVLAAMLALAACGRAPDSAKSAEGEPQFEAPAPESEPSRNFAPSNDAATGATGALTVSVTQHLAEANGSGQDAAPREIIMLTGANGAALEAELVGTASPATLVEGQTLRALMDLPLEASGTLLYRVTRETKAHGRGFCGAQATGHVLTWEPETAGEPVFKLMGLMGGAPGQDGVRVCPALSYRRS